MTDGLNRVARRAHSNYRGLALLFAVLLIIAGGVQHTFTATRVVQLEKRVGSHLEDAGFHAALKARLDGYRELIEILARRQNKAEEDVDEMRRIVNFSCISETDMREIVREEIRHALAARGVGWRGGKE